MTKNKILKIGKIVFLLIAVLATALWYLSFCEFGRDYLDDIEIKSPDGNYTLIIKEWGTIGTAGAKIYCKNKKGKTKLLGNTSSDDSEFPFRDGDYLVEWDVDSVLIRYFSGRGSQQMDNPDTWEKVRYALP